MTIPTLHLISGLPGAGKTTYARTLANELAAARFCPDDWMREANIGMRNYPIRQMIEHDQLLLALRIMQQGTDTILEWGTWGADERIAVANTVHQHGYLLHAVFLILPLPTLQHRIAHRNTIVPPDQNMTDEEHADAVALWQPPTPEELALYDSHDIITS